MDISTSMTREELGEQARLIGHLGSSVDVGDYFKRGLTAKQIETILIAGRIPGGVDSIPDYILIRNMNYDFWMNGRSSVELDYEHVEFPVREAVKQLHAKNVETFMSSANYRDVGRKAFISLEELSERNKAVLGEQFPDNYVQGHSSAEIYVPVGVQTTVGEVKSRMEEIVCALETQPLTWGYGAMQTRKWDTNGMKGIGTHVYDPTTHIMFSTPEMCVQYHLAESPEQKAETEERVEAMKKIFSGETRAKWEHKHEGVLTMVKESWSSFMLGGWREREALETRSEIFFQTLAPRIREVFPETTPYINDKEQKAQEKRWFDE